MVAGKSVPDGPTSAHATQPLRFEARLGAKFRTLVMAAGAAIAVVAAGTALAVNASTAQSAQPKTSSGADTGRKTVVGEWQAPQGALQIPIWPSAAPDSSTFHKEAEKVLTAQTPNALEGGISQAVLDVTSPTITIFPPKRPSKRSAVIVLPGGGFKAVVVTLQGTEICKWLTEQGVTCILAKYRVPKTAHHYDPDCDCAVTPEVPRALQDAQRTIRLVRSRAQQLGVDPNKIGVMGFSAGGYLAVQTSNIFAPAYKVVDAIDRVNSRPDFAVVFYPGHICREGDKLDSGLRVTKRTPPTFLLQAWDDPVDPVCNGTLYVRALDAAGVPTEAHFFEKGGHAFGLRRMEHSVRIWPLLVQNWLRDQGVL